jgi:UDP:flavonoid glycosyltransferase YjiC (YdhE family)
MGPAPAHLTGRAGARIRPEDPSTQLQFANGQRLGQDRRGNVRVLITTTPGTGHIMPMVPVAQALQHRGHDVVWATGPDAQHLVANAGLSAAVAGLAVAPRNARFRELRPDLGSLPPRQRRGALFPTMFATLAARPMYDDLLRLVSGRRPDLIIHEPCELAAAPLARSLGVPAANLAFGRLFDDELLASAAADAELARVWADAGHETPVDLGFYDGPYLHPLPPSMEDAPPDRTLQLARPTCYDGSPDPTGPPETIDRSRPSVYVTFGTEFGPMAPWSAVVEALAALDADALLTVGGQVDPASLGPLPTGVQVERWVPQRLALARSDVVVSHGGSGAMLGAAAAGLPHLALPIAADQFDNADMISRHGSGAMLEPADVEPQRIAAGILRLLSHDDSLVDAARIAAEIAAMPSLDEAAAQLERSVEQQA